MLILFLTCSDLNFLSSSPDLLSWISRAALDFSDAFSLTTLLDLSFSMVCSFCFKLFTSAVAGTLKETLFLNSSVIYQ